MGNNKIVNRNESQGL